MRPHVSATFADLPQKRVATHPQPCLCGSRVARARTAPSMGFDMEASIQETKDLRLKHLEEQAMLALKLAVENHEHPVFPNAMVSGRCRQA